MSSFTMTLSEMRAANPGETFGLESYPIHDELYRPVLNQKIVDHFWTREIGVETPSLFRHKLRTFMNIQMPYFNKLYESELLKVDPLTSQRIETLRENTATIGNTSTEETQGNTDTKGRSASTAMDMPQSELAEYGDYASGANHTVQDSQVAQKGDSTTSSDTESKTNGKDVISGYTQPQAELLTIYRSTLLNLDADIINLIEQENLFMKIWATSEEYSRRENQYGYFPLYPYRWL